MPRKKTQEEILQEFKEVHKDRYDYSLVEYKNRKAKVCIICPDHSEFWQTPEAHMTGSGCVKCSYEERNSAKRHSFNYIKSEFGKRDYKLLSNRYVNSGSPLEYICSNGHKGSIRFNDFRKGVGCPECAGLKPLGIDKVKQYFDKFGYTLLSKEWVNNQTKIKFECPIGHIGEITFGNFQQGVRCRQCYLESNTGDGNPRWIEDRKLVQDRLEARSRCARLIKQTYNRIGGNKEGSTIEELGYSAYDLLEHITSHPNWENVDPDNFHIDHYFPVASFVRYGIKDVKLINCLENLRPTTPKENMEKNDKYDLEEFEKWLTSKNVKFESKLELV